MLKESITRHDFGVYEDQDDIVNFLSDMHSESSALAPIEQSEVKKLIEGRYQFNQLLRSCTINSGEETSKPIFISSYGDYCYGVVITSFDINGGDMGTVFNKLYIVDGFEEVMGILKTELGL